MMLIMRMKMMRWLEVSGGDLMCDHSWGRTSNKARATCIILTFPLLSSNIEIGKSHLYLTHLCMITRNITLMMIINHRTRREPSTTILSPKVFFMIITIIIEYRTRPYQPTCRDKDIRFHSDLQSSMA